MGLWFAVTEPRADRSWIGSEGAVQIGYRSGKSSLGHVAKGASLISIDRKRLVEKQQFAEQLDLLHLVVWRLL